MHSSEYKDDVHSVEFLEKNGFRLNRRTEQWVFAEDAGIKQLLDWTINSEANHGEYVNHLSAYDIEEVKVLEHAEPPSTRVWRNRNNKRKKRKGAKKAKRQRVEATKGEEVDLDEMQDEGLDEMGEVVEEKKEEENCVNVSVVVL